MSAVLSVFTETVSERADAALADSFASGLRRTRAFVRALNLREPFGWRLPASVLA